MSANEKTRLSNYDLLRVICTIEVIALHISATYLGFQYVDSSKYVQLTVTMLYNTLSRFAVPCFFMLSGALLLSKPENVNRKYFYKKTFVNIVVPTIIFTIIYFIYSLIITSFSIILNGKSSLKLLDPVLNVIKGEPYYHMWYLYTLIGIYFFVPLIQRFKESLDDKQFSIFCWSYFVVANISGWTSTFVLHWSIGQVACYIGYILIGYQLSLSKKNNRAGIARIISGILILIFLSFFRYYSSVSSYVLLPATISKYSLISNFSPLVVFASLLVFSGFSLITVKNDRLCGILEKISKDSFYIYLFHAGVWSAFSILIKVIKINDSIYLGNLCLVVCFFISWGLSKIYKRAWHEVDKKYHIINKSCMLFDL